MTIDDYMNSMRFPTTSGDGYSPEMQLRMDAFNLDALNEEIELGHSLNPQQQSALKELRIKEPHIGPLSAEVARQKEAVSGNQDETTGDDEVAKHPALRPFPKMTRERLRELVQANRAAFDDTLREANERHARREM